MSNEHALSNNIKLALSEDEKGVIWPSKILYSVLWYFTVALLWVPPAFWILYPLSILILGLDYFNVIAAVVWLAVTIGLLFWLIGGLRLLRRDRSPVQPDAKQRPAFGSVAVIGAGPVGLAAIKELSEQGVPCICYEASDGVGGVFRYSPGRKGGVWPSARLTSSPWVTAYSDFPPASDDNAHWHHTEYLDYLERYAEVFGLKDSIRFRHSVLSVEPDGAQWRLNLRNEVTGEEFSDRVDAVAISTGLSSQAKPITVPGVDRFGGDVINASDYDGPSRYRDKRVMIVGLGESAADIAYELAGVAHQTFLSVRRGKFIIPRVNPRNGIANDYDTNRLRYATPVVVRDTFMHLRRLLCARLGEMDITSRLRHAFLTASEAGALSQPVTKSDDFLVPIIDGRLKVCPDVEQFDETGVVLSDGRREPLDAVVFAHGYQPAWRFLKLPGDLKARHPGELYLNMFDPRVGPSLAFLGYARPAIGSFPTTGEMQARYFALLAAGERQLPDRSAMIADIEAAQKRNARTFPTLATPNAIVEWIPYLDKLAGLVGCRPDPWRLIRSPRLLWKMATGPMTGAMYRLHGSGAKPEQARRTVLRLRRGHQLFELFTLMLLHIYSVPIAFFSRNKNLRRTNEII